MAREPARHRPGPARRGALLLLLVTALLVGMAVAAPAGLAQTPGDCDQLTGPARVACDASAQPGQDQGGPGLGDRIRDAASGLVGGVVTNSMEVVMQGLAGTVGSAAAWVLERLGGLLAATTGPHVGAAWYRQRYHLVLALAATLTVPMLLLGVIQNILRGDGIRGLLSILGHLGVAGIFSGVAPAIVLLLLALTDWMSLAVGGDPAEFNAAMQQVATRVGGIFGGAGVVTGNPAVPVFLLLVTALLVLSGAVVVWLELILRIAAIDVAVLFLPLGFGAMVWPELRRWGKRLIEVIAALVFSKFFIVAIISLALQGLAGGEVGSEFAAQPGQGQSGLGGEVGLLVVSAAMLLLAALTPVAMLKFVPVIEGTISSAYLRSHISEIRSTTGLSTAQGVTTSVATARAINAWGTLRGQPDPGKWDAAEAARRDREASRRLSRMRWRPPPGQGRRAGRG